MGWNIQNCTRICWRYALFVSIRPPPRGSTWSTRLCRPSDPPLVALEVAGLRDSLNAAAVGVRVVGLFSHTCAVCLRGAHELQSAMAAVLHLDARVFVVWEAVLATDWDPPSTGTLSLVPDPRATQFWDRPCGVSAAIHAAGDPRVLGRRRLKGAIVWDYVAVFAPGTRWERRYPAPDYAASPVVAIVDELRAHLLRY